MHARESSIHSARAVGGGSLIEFKIYVELAARGARAGGSPNLPKVSSQRYDKIINAITGVVRGQYDCFILPIVFLCVPVAAVLADLKQRLRLISGFSAVRAHKVGRSGGRREMKDERRRVGVEISLNQWEAEKKKKREGKKELGACICVCICVPELAGGSRAASSL